MSVMTRITPANETDIPMLLSLNNRFAASGLTLTRSPEFAANHLVYLYYLKKRGEPDRRTLLGLISIGHSFGAQVLLRATASTLEQQLISLNAPSGYLRQATPTAPAGDKKALQGIGDLVILLTHLLKWQYQPDLRSTSWAGSIVEHRHRILDEIEDSPSLARYPSEVFGRCYSAAREQAAAETALPRSVFPETSPYTVEQALDPDFLPD